MNNPEYVWNRKFVFGKIRKGDTVMSSFSANAKAEICRTLPQKRCCALAECFGILLFCNSFGMDGIRIITESREFSQCLPKLFKKAFQLDFDQKPDMDSSGKLVFQISDTGKLETIMDSFGFTAGKTLAVHINLPVVEDECCKASFLRGAFRPVSVCPPAGSPAEEPCVAGRWTHS